MSTTQEEKRTVDRQFKTVVIDPPWRVSAGRAIGRYEVVGGKQVFGVTDNRARELEYPSMSVGEIAALPIEQLCEDAAHLYLWTINRYLREAFDLINSWGFRYSTTLVWAKAPMGGGLGGSYGLASEFCLFARRGVLKATSRVGRNWFNWKRPYKNGKPHHSAKPPEFFSLVESVSPAPRLEMFARSLRAGWDVWGNEVTPTIQIPKGDHQ